MIVFASAKNPNTTRIALAREFAKHPAFKLVELYDIIASLKYAEREGLLILTPTDAYILHDPN